MRKEGLVLNVQMLGGFAMIYEGKVVPIKRKTTTRAMKLLQLLLYAGEEGITRTKLLEALYGSEDVTDVANNFRVTAHRCKKMLLDAGLPDFDYIVEKKGVYYWKSEMEIHLDVKIFLSLIDQGENENEEEKMRLYKEACRLYRGEFLPELSGEEWALLEAVHLKNIYAAVLTTLCEYKKEKKEYSDVIELCKVAEKLYPFDEWQSQMIECYIATEQYKEATMIYEATAKLFFEELGISPSENMMNQFQEMSKRMSRRNEDISEIKDALDEEEEIEGSFYCSLPSFRDSFRLVTRIMERTGHSIFLVLVSIADGNGYPIENKKKLEVLSQELFDTIKLCLRKGDSYTKYSPGQFLILLVGTDQENCEIVIDRIKRHYSREHRTWSNNLVFQITSAAEVELDDSNVCFEENNVFWEN